MTIKEKTTNTLRNACLVGGAGLLVLLLVIDLTPANVSLLNARFYISDKPWLVASGLLAIGLAFGAPPQIGALIPFAARHLRWASAAMIAYVLIVAVLGTSIVFQRFGLSRDEAMAQFDASVFLAGHLFAVVPVEWRTYVDALEPLFILSVKNHDGWVSSYLPVNAAIRSAFAFAATPLLAGPSLFAIALAALIGIARRLWPDRPDAAIVAGLILASSTQAAVTAMTPYAMTAHLAFNLVWLFLFLQNTKVALVGAVVVGFFATGLHQLAFHPLFVAPFIAALWCRGRYAEASAYTFAYAGIALFWMNYWPLMFDAFSLYAEPLNAHVSFASRVAHLAHMPNLHDLEVMLMNAVRFIAWQNPILAPMVLMTLSRPRSWTDTTYALLAGIVATLVVVSAVMVDQGLGWGYRYLHGFIGSFALFATYGYVELTGECCPETVRALPARIVTATMFAVLVALPLRSMETRNFASPYAAAETRIQTSRSDLVFIDPDAMMNAGDLVRNEPTLSKKPLVFDLTRLDPQRIRALCASYDVAIFDKSDGQNLGIPFAKTDHTEQIPSLRALMRSLDCGHKIIGRY